jgi:hypothetical protein
MRSRPFVFYCHPYEFDPREFAEIALNIPLKVRLHQGLGRGRFQARFDRLISTFGGCRMIDLLDRQEWPEYRLDASTTSSQPNGTAGQPQLPLAQ